MTQEQIEILKRLNQLRIGKKFTQKEFAEAIKKSPAIVQQWETNKKFPHKSTLNHIIYTFNLNRDWLLEGTGEMFSSEPQKINDDGTVSMFMVEQKYLPNFKTAAGTVLLANRGIKSEIIKIPRAFIKEGVNLNNIICTKVSLASDFDLEEVPDGNSRFNKFVRTEKVLVRSGDYVLVDLSNDKVSDGDSIFLVASGYKKFFENSDKSFIEERPTKRTVFAFFDTKDSGNKNLDNDLIIGRIVGVYIQV